jgi:LmbE family N-acetylglucosaminyl deacetylase
MPKTILAIGAHYDDCPFGIPGILLKAVRKNYRVVILAMIGDYTNWKPVQGREDLLLKRTVEICKEFGVEMRFLDFASMRYDVTQENKRKVAEAVADIKPDIAFNMWPHDQHTDHEMTSRLAKVALKHGDRLLPKGQPYRTARKVYLYDNGPRHTIGFEPNAFVDVSDEWPQVMEWLGRFMALVRNEKFDPTKLDGAQRAKESLARYRGATCGVKYAEAVRSVNEYPVEIL